MGGLGVRLSFIKSIVNFFVSTGRRPPCRRDRAFDLNGACMSAAKIRAARRMEIITGVERRRRWTLEEKLRIVAETEQPGAGIAEIARRYEISRGLLWNWRSQVRRGVLMAEPPQVFLRRQD